MRDAGLAFLFALLTFGVLHALDPRLADYDGYFHIRFASLGPMAWMGSDFPWMPHSVFADGHWVDHQLLFHALQWPFTLAFDALTAAHVSAAVFAALAVAAWTWALHRRGVPGAWMWSLALLGASRFFVDRMLMPRTQALSLALMMVGLALALEARLLAVAAVGFGFAWTYHVSALLIPIAGMAALLTRDWRVLAAGTAGVVAGFVLHPQSPDTLSFFWLHAVEKVLNPGNEAVGAEWMAAPPLAWAVHTAPVLVLLLSLLPGLRRTGAETRLLGLFGLGWLALSLGAVKWVEYAVPFLVFAAALAWRDLGRSPRWALLFVPLIAFNGWQTMLHVQGTLPPVERLQGVAEALPAEDCAVFHADWTDFSELFFHAPQCSYVVGLDPHFLSAADPRRHELVEAALAGQVSELGRMAEEAFGAGWVVTTNPAMRHRAMADERLELVHEDEHGGLWRVLAVDEPAGAVEDVGPGLGDPLREDDGDPPVDEGGVGLDGGGGP